MENEDNVIIPPSAEVNERLWTNRSDPNVILGYNSVWGEGAAEAYLDSRSGNAPAGADRVIPSGAINYLQGTVGQPNHTAAVTAFNNLYGAGAATAALAPPEPLPAEAPPGILTEWYRTTVGGAQDAAHGIVDFTGWAAEAVSRFSGTMVNNNGVWTYMRGAELTEFYQNNRDQAPTEIVDNIQEATDFVPANETTSGAISRGFVQFLVPYTAAMRFTGAANTMVNGLAMGAAVDFTVWDPDDPNMTGALADYFGVEDNLMVDLLATNPDDPEWENRLRNAVEGSVVGGAVEGVLGLVGRAAVAIRAGRAARAAGDPVAEAAAREELQQIANEAENAVGQEAGRVLEEVQATREAIDEAAAQEAAAATPAETAAPAAAEAAPAAAEAPTSGVRLTEAEIQRIQQLAELYKNDPTRAMMENLPWRTENVTQGWDDVAATLVAVRQVFAESFDEAGMAPQTLEEIRNQAVIRAQEMAAQLNTTPAELLRSWGVLNVPHAQQSAELLARSMVLNTLWREIQETARMLNAGDFDRARFPHIEAARADFNYRMELATNLAVPVAGSRSATGRSLRAARETARATGEALEAIKTAMAAGDLDARIRMIAEGEHPARAQVARPFLRRLMEAVNRFHINSMLSGIGTFKVNLTGSGSNVLLDSVRLALGGNPRAAARHFKGMLYGSWDSIKMGARAAYEDGPVLATAGTKFDYDLSKNATGFVNKVVGLPSRALMATDELLLNSNYRGYVRASAEESADAAGLRGAARERHIQQYIKDSFTSEGQATRSDLLELAQRGTFTEPLRPGSWPQRFAHGTIIGDNAGAAVWRLFIPFFKTPVNILKQSFQHMPVIGLLSKELREDLAAGGLRAANARGKMVLGASIASVATYYVMNGRITGSGPTDPAMNAEWRAAGNQPYSIRLTNEEGQERWISYARYEPLSNILGVIADTYEITANPYNEDTRTSEALMGGIILALAENTVNKTFTRGISDLFDLMQGERNASSALKNFFGSFIPNIFNQLNGDEYFRDVRTYKDVVYSRIAGYENVAPNRNILGEPFVRPNAKWDPLGWFTHRGWQTPDPLLTEMYRLSMVDRSAFQPAQSSIRLDGRTQNLRDIRHSETGRPLYDMWMERTGTIEIGGMTLRETLETFMASRRYVNDMVDGAPGFTGETRGREMARIITQFRQAAAQDIPELLELQQRSAQQARDTVFEQLLNGGGTPTINRPLFPTQ